MKLNEVFSAAAKLLSEGFSILPVSMPDKKPLGTWTEYQEEPITYDEFCRRSLRINGDVGIALITGKVSGNLEAIDLDDKHYHGIGDKFLRELQSLHPDIYTKLRIERTINKGVHIIYRVYGEKLYPKNGVLAARPATAEELESNPKLKKIGFIEIKTNGGKITIPPTKGYSIVQNDAVQVISRHEADLIINLAKLYNEVIERPIKPYRNTNRGFSNYSTNPWEDYNENCDLVGLLIEHGWSVVKSNSRYVFMSRPDEKKAGSVSASVVRAGNFLYVFSTSTPFEVERGISASSVLAKLKFNDNYSETFAYLVSCGYGRLTQAAERRAIKEAIINKAQLPSNISEKSKETYSKEITQYSTQFPHGIFWEVNEKDGYRINRHLVIEVLNSMGYVRHDGELYKKQGSELINCHINTDFGKAAFINNLHGYVYDKSDLVEILGVFETFMEKSLKYIISRINILDENLLLADTQSECFKIFTNGILRITGRDVDLIPFNENDKLYFSDWVIQRDYNIEAQERGDFVDFINKAIFDKKNIKEYLGYLLHNYKSSAEPYIILFLEAVSDPKKGGGSGKNVLTSLLGLMNSLHEVPASQLKFTGEFFQSWRGQRIMAVSDLPKRFDFAFLKNISSNSAIIKRLYKDEFVVDANKLPKIILQSNYSSDISDGGIKRRVRTCEFTDFFTVNGGVDVYYGGKYFPRDWTDIDWDGYIAFMVSAIQSFLRNPKLKNTDLSEVGWDKQFSLNHGSNTYEFISGKIEDWCSLNIVPRADIIQSYSVYCNENTVPLSFRKSAASLNDAIMDYCEHFGIKYVKQATYRINGITKKCSTFYGAENKSDMSAVDEDPF